MIVFDPTQTDPVILTTCRDIPEHRILINHRFYESQWKAYQCIQTSQDNILGWLTLCHLGFHVPIDRPCQGVIMLMGSTDGMPSVPRDLTSLEIKQVKQSIRIGRRVQHEYFF